MIEVYFKELNYHQLLETESYGLPNLLADLGGQLGLWLGVSVLTCMEFAVFLTSVCALLFGRNETKKACLTEEMYNNAEAATLKHFGIDFGEFIDDEHESVYR